MLPHLNEKKMSKLSIFTILSKKSAFQQLLRLLLLKSEELCHIELLLKFSFKGCFKNVWFEFPTPFYSPCIPGGLILHIN